MIVRQCLLFAFILPFFCKGQSSINKELRVGVNLNSPPFGFINEHNDTVGVDIELSKAIAKKLDLKLKKIPIEGAKHREEIIENHKVDLVVAVYSVTPERSRKILFSKSYFNTKEPLAILTKRGSGIGIYYDLVGKDYGIVEKSISEEYNTNILEQEIKEKKKRLPEPLLRRDQAQVLKDFFTGKTQAIIDDRELLKYWQEQDPTKYELIGLPKQKEDSYAIGMSRSDSSYLTSANEVIDACQDSIPVWMARFYKQKHQISSHKSLIGYLVILFAFIPIFFFFLKSKVTPPDEIPPETKKENTQDVLFRRSNFAWIIANSDYKFQSHLNGHPYNDASSLSTALKPYGYLEDNIFTLKDATRADIVGGFEELSQRKSNYIIPFANRITENDSLIVYYSGHGDYRQGANHQKGYWVPIEAKSTSDYIMDIEIKAHLNDLGLNQVLLVSDSCFAGKLLNGMRDISPVAFNIQDIINPCIEIITSGNNRVPSESLFAREFTEILLSNTKPYLTTDEINLMLKNRLGGATYYFPQYGSLSIKNIGGKFVFIKGSLLTDTQQAKPQERNPKDEFFKLFSVDARFQNYFFVKSTINISDQEFDRLIQELRQEGKIEMADNNSIFITPKGLRQGQK
jgi:ABC-type amino acid transport substrate-binding protein